MHQEVEIQVEIENPDEVEKKLLENGKITRVCEQVDKYYVTPQNDFFSQNPVGEYLRIRYEKDKSHLNYSQLHFNGDGWLEVSDEYETSIEKPEIAEEIFKGIGLILKITVSKRRKYFDCGDFEVTLDEVEGLGNFMEVEAKEVRGSIEQTRNSCINLLSDLEIRYKIRREMGYPNMLYQKKNNG